MPNLTTDQAAAVSREGGALLVSAAAGSGKTMVLVERLLRQLEAGHDLTEFLIITYTNAAAAELRGKIAARLSRALAEQPDNRHLRRQTHLLYLAQISTIHAFCGTLLRQYAHLRDLPPEFRVADEQQVRLLRQQVMERLLVERYEQAEPGFLALAETMGSGRSDSRLTAAALSLYDTLRTHARPEQWLDQCRAQLALDGVTDAGATVWGAETLHWLRQTAASQCRRLEQALNLAREDEKLARGYVPSLAQTQQVLLSLSGAERWEQARALLPVPFLRFGAVRGADETAKARITALRDHAKKAASAMETAVYASSAAVLRDLQGTVPATLALLELAVEFGRRFTREKRRRSMLDFSDLEHETIALLTDRYTGAPTAAAQDIAARYHEVMVDEYQDCNEVQDTIFRAVSGEGTRLFMVGDVKQSIYRFRLADPGIFLEKYRSYQLEAPRGEPCKVLLSRNFRSRAAILEAVNHVFTTCMSAQVGELDYGPDEALHPGAVRVPLPGPAVELHVVTGGSEEQTRVAREAAFVAARIRRMLDEGTPVAGPDGQLRPVTPGDIVILLRSPRSVAADYLAALERWDIPASGGGGGSLLDTTEAQVLLATLRAIDNPHQDIPLAAAMASPVFGFTAEDLAQIRQAAEGDFCTALTARAADDPRCAAFLARLADWRTLSQTQPLPELIWTVMRQTEMEAIFGALPGGAQRRRNLLSLYEASMGFHGGLTAFLDAMELRRTTDGMEPQPVAEGAGCVRLMSIHKSKGLEFPVVFLCDLARSFNLTDLSEPLLCHPRLGVGAMAVDLEQMQQYSTFARSAIRQQLLNETLSGQLRVLYVAMTRASERMILVHCEKKGRGRPGAGGLRRLSRRPLCGGAGGVYGSLGADGGAAAARGRGAAPCSRGRRGPHCAGGGPLGHWLARDGPAPARAGGPASRRGGPAAGFGPAGRLCRPSCRRGGHAVEADGHPAEGPLSGRRGGRGRRGLAAGHGAAAISAAALCRGADGADAGRARRGGAPVHAVCRLCPLRRGRRRAGRAGAPDGGGVSQPRTGRGRAAGNDPGLFLQPAGTAGAHSAASAAGIQVFTAGRRGAVLPPGRGGGAGAAAGRGGLRHPGRGRHHGHRLQDRPGAARRRGRARGPIPGPADGLCPRAGADLLPAGARDGALVLFHRDGGGRSALRLIHNSRTSRGRRPRRCRTRRRCRRPAAPPARRRGQCPWPRRGSASRRGQAAPRGAG